jgi:hypothetical protein
MMRVIVRLHEHIHAQLYWRDGAVFEWGGGRNLALVKVAQTQTGRDCIQIQVNGPAAGRRDLLSAVRIQFDEIHKKLVKIGVKEMVPLPDYPDVCLSRTKLETLLRSDERFHTDVVDDSAGNEIVIKVDIAELLEGVARPQDMDRERGGDTHIYLGKVRQEKIMGNKLEIKKSTLNHSPVGQNQTIADSFNTIKNADCGEGVKQALTKLTELVDQLQQDVADKETRDTLNSDLQALVTEATKAEPRRKWLKLSGEGLIDAAKTVASMTKPITTAVAGLLKLFAGVG